MFGIGQARVWRAAALALAVLALAWAQAVAAETTVEELKARVANASVADRAELCLQISERQLQGADRDYVAGDSDKGRAALVDVEAFSELARDYSIQSHKHEKQSEIAIRKMVRKLGNLKHTVALEDQKQIQETIDRLQRIRDDLLAAMFPKGVKK